MTYYIIWTLAIISIIFFVVFFLYPYILERIMWIKLSRVFKDMSKRYDGETKEQLEDIAKQMKQAGKDTEL